MNNLGSIILTLVIVIIFVSWRLLDDSSIEMHNSLLSKFNPGDIQTNSERWDVSNRGYWVGRGAAKGHNFDSSLAQSLLQLQEEDCRTVLKLGGGTGAYARYLTAHGIYISCYDGNPSTQENTQGTCGILDFSKPLNLSPEATKVKNCWCGVI